MENSNKQNDVKKDEQKEKIVSLNEDSRKHKHDDASFEKLMKEQEKFKK